MAEPVICPNCHAEMEPGKRTKTRVVRYTEYTCPNGCAPRSEGRLLPGRAPRSVIPRTEIDAEIVENASAEELVVDENEPEIKDEEEPETEDDK